MLRIYARKHNVHSARLETTDSVAGQASRYKGMSQIRRVTKPRTLLFVPTISNISKQATPNRDFNTTSFDVFQCHRISMIF